MEDIIVRVLQEGFQEMRPDLGSDPSNMAARIAFQVMSEYAGRSSFQCKVLLVCAIASKVGSSEGDGYIWRNEQYHVVAIQPSYPGAEWTLLDLAAGRTPCMPEPYRGASVVEHVSAEFIAGKGAISSVVGHTKLTYLAKGEVSTECFEPLLTIHRLFIDWLREIIEIDLSSAA